VAASASLNLDRFLDLLRILELWEVGNYESDLVDLDLMPLHAGFQ